MAAPTATASSGFTSRRGSLPKNSLTFSCTFGIRVMPPTRMMSSISPTFTPASLIAIRHGSMVRSIRSSTSDSSFARVIFRFKCFFQALQRKHVAAQIDALILLELADDVFDDALVKIFAAEERVAVGREHFELLLAVNIRDLDDRYVERAAAQVVHRDLAVALFVLVQTERERGCGRFVDDALHVQTGDTARAFRSLTLAVVKVGRNRNDGFRHFFAEIVFSGLLHLAQHFSRDLRRWQFLIAGFDPRSEEHTSE